MQAAGAAGPPMDPAIFALIQSTVQSEFRAQLPSIFSSGIGGNPGDPTMQQAMSTFIMSFHTTGQYQKLMHSSIDNFMKSEQHQGLYKSAWDSLFTSRESQDTIMALSQSVTQSQMQNLGSESGGDGRDLRQDD